MDMTGEYRIEAPRDVVWQALNDPGVLKRCIPGCEELTKDSDDGFSAKVKAKIGPVSAKFSGSVTLSDIVAPESYTISGEGKGGAAGFAKGGAKVRLAEDGGATKLSYEVTAQVGGKLAQIGSRLVDGSAKKLAGQFFENFATAVTESAGAAAPSVPDTPSTSQALASPPAGPATEAPPPKAPSPTPQSSAAAAESSATTQDPAGASPGSSPGAPADASSADTEPSPQPSAASSGLPPSVWVTGLIVATGVLVLVFAL